nr:hypothetical protein [uncultured Gellertiella sp.]
MLTGSEVFSVSVPVMPFGLVCDCYNVAVIGIDGIDIHPLFEVLKAAIPAEMPTKALLRRLVEDRSVGAVATNNSAELFQVIDYNRRNSPLLEAALGVMRQTFDVHLQTPLSRCGSVPLFCSLGGGFWIC